MSIATLEPSLAPVGALAGKYLTFILGSESYGMPVSAIREIVRMPEVTPIPETPDYVRGVLNLRGGIIPVIDLRRSFKLSHDGIDDRTCVLVIEMTLSTGETLRLGLVVDGVEEVVNVRREEIEEAPRFGGRLGADYLLGIAKIKGKVSIVLDIEAVLCGQSLEDVSALAH